MTLDELRNLCLQGQNVAPVAEGRTLKLAQKIVKPNDQSLTNFKAFVTVVMQ
jgi:hypothetical protein